MVESLPLLQEAGATALVAEALGELGDTKNLMGDAAGAVLLLDEALRSTARLAPRGHRHDVGRAHTPHGYW